MNGLQSTVHLYQAFDLDIQRASSTIYYAQVVNSPSGQASEHFAFPLTADESKIFQTWRGLDGSALRTIGTRLFHALFAGAVNDCWRSSLAIVQQRNEGLRLHLRLTDVPELAQIPWELLYDPSTARFLALSVRTPIVRYLNLFQPERPLVIGPPLRILAVLANPVGMGLPTNVEEEWQVMATGLAPLQAEGRLVLERLQNPTLTSLQQRLLGKDIHILHFAGHGFYDPDLAEGVLVFEDEDKTAAGYKIIHTDQLAILLHNHRALRLVYLSACQGALAGDQQVFTGVAQALVRQEIPAAIAMQAEIGDKAAVHFAQAFYTAIAAQYPVDAAITHARVALASINSFEWPKPVLFSRAHQNNLFANGRGVNKELILPISSTDEVAPVFELLHFEPQTVLIPAGPFLMGSTADDGIPATETPQLEIYLPAYRIGAYPVTNMQYAEFVRQTGRLVSATLGWDGQYPAPGTERLPVVGVTYADAIAYCTWLSNRTGRKYTLPSEAQWEKAARGDDGRSFPWGNEWQEGRCNVKGENLSPVSAFPSQSPFGCYDLVGNVRQWTCTIWGESFRVDKRYAYPWQADERNDPNSNIYLRRVVRGSAYTDDQNDCRCAVRGSSAPDNVGPPRKRLGFRVAIELDHL